MHLKQVPKASFGNHFLFSIVNSLTEDEIQFTLSNIKITMDERKVKYNSPRIILSNTRITTDEMRVNSI